ncbi:PglZ domain-containing protein [Bacillus anthracis]|uniref:PglZ domain-containing protein n=1 Tax=Bacillus TaxID=1386 RepID=UPI0008FDD179|nr:MULTISPECIES: PglZ domain-containing protein [Bacillus]MBL3852439.1 PglZ domain-containing protein [Bacillus cereus]MDR4410053.1 PglZ domain-containing protein [Bacillus anthracis]OJE21761.1 alkaline phosphatase [Bacillus paranthracis]TSI15278.1 PglZ domain-containing protein [Bacillus sp. HY001]
MIDILFKNDLLNIYDRHSVAVFIDESGDAEFLLKTVEGEFTIYQTNSELEELHVKYLIEKTQPSNERFLIYTRSKKDELKFIREYCETCGCLEIRYLQSYIKDKVHQTLNLNINLKKEELIAAAKVSVGKDRAYWIDLSHKGAAEIFDLNKELLPFVHDPDTYSKEKYDAQLREAFYQKVNELLGQDYLLKPATTLAGEVVKAMLDGLAEGNCNKTLQSVYQNWLDSVSYRDSFNEYLGGYTLSTELDIWKVSIHHPFIQVDERWMAEIGKNLSDKASIPNILAKLRQRNQSRQAQTLGILFWNDVIALLEFDSKDITYLSSFSECVEFYKKHFCKLDTAIRNLYAEFLNKKELLEPFQELYKEHSSVFLDKWFEHWSDYKENQTGILQRIIDAAGGLKTAVIVGDGVAYEIAELVATKVKGPVNLKRDSILADIPSETENNMSRIYMDNGVTEAVQSNREKYLAVQNSNVTIDFIRLDEVNEEARSGQFLICTYKDIDDMGEKLQQKALKYIPETIDFFAEKISLLLSSGYGKVYLITDHGFVLTGLLSEADKISISPKGEFDKAERYIRTESKQTDLTPALVEAKKSYKQFEYLYFAKNINPFKTPGLYGFSHGGVSPQELVTPYFCWERSGASIASLPVSIENKGDLKDVTGELFSIKIQADKGAGDLFSMERKVYLVFFANKTQVNRSDIFIIQRNERITKEYTFDGYPEIEVHLLDAATKQQLDRAVVKQNKDRDLGGLL